MRDYEEALLNKLNENVETLTVRGVPVTVKPVPDPEGADHLDPRVHREVVDGFADEHSQQLSEPTQRARMGRANYNMNRQEIWTKYLTVDTSCGQVPVWVYYPRHLDGLRPALLYAHGGAFKGGTPFMVENPCRLIAERANCVVFNIDYALPPEHPYPVPVQQVYEVLAHVAAHAWAYHVDASRIFAAGDSAGGNLAACCAVMDAARNTRYLAGQALIYAKLIFDNHRVQGYARDETQFTLCAEQQQYLGGLTAIGSEEANAADARVYLQGAYDCMLPQISPVTFARKELLPPTLLLLSEYDGLRLEGEFYASQLQAAGVTVREVRYRGMSHGFLDRLGIYPQAEDAVNEIVRWIEG